MTSTGTRSSAGIRLLAALLLAASALWTLAACDNNKDAAFLQRNPEQLAADFNYFLLESTGGDEVSFDEAAYPGLTPLDGADGYSAVLQGFGQEGAAGAEVSYSVELTTDAEMQIIAVSAESDSFYAPKLFISLAQSFDLQLSASDLEQIRTELHFDEAGGQSGSTTYTYKLHGLNYTYNPQAGTFSIVEK
ncbi:MAG: hypothetical protein LBR39_00265 [Coriobacteriales bacterium]|nr:hypothetical protein [Coriobacteriales bacterium]